MQITVSLAIEFVKDKNINGDRNADLSFRERWIFNENSDD